MKGFTQIYTGNGKGKTTAAIGLAIRASGAGKKIFIAQFTKGRGSSEVNVISDYIPNITIKQFGRENFILREPEEEDHILTQKGFKEVVAQVFSRYYEMVVLDEIFIALQYGLITEQALVSFLQTAPDNVEIILTGRNAPQKIIDMADLVTEMKEVKHYFENGIQAREGIEY